jgi:hypothetical protein
MDGTREALLGFKRDGHQLIIHSVRGDKGGHVRDWMNYFKLPFDSITNIKPNADLFIDDKALRFTNWNDMIDAVAEEAQSDLYPHPITGDPR